MKENIGDILFDALTSEFKDKIDRNKDFIDYLKEKTKTELLSVYLLYGYAGRCRFYPHRICRYF